MGSRETLCMLYHQLGANRALMLFNAIPMRTRRVLSLYKVYGISALLVLNRISALMPFWCSTDNIIRIKPCSQGDAASTMIVNAQNYTSTCLCMVMRGGGGGGLKIVYSVVVVYSVIDILIETAWMSEHLYSWPFSGPSEHHHTTHRHQRSTIFLMEPPQCWTMKV